MNQEFIGYIFLSSIIQESAYVSHVFKIFL